MENKHYISVLTLKTEASCLEEAQDIAHEFAQSYQNDDNLNTVVKSVVVINTAVWGDPTKAAPVEE